MATQKISAIAFVLAFAAIRCEGRLQIKVDESTGSFQIIPPEGMNHIQVFESFDSDQSGSIEEAEFEVALHSLGYNVTADGALKYFKKCDKDGSGAIDLNELDVAIAEEKTAPAAVAAPAPASLPGVDAGKCLDAVKQIHTQYMETHTDQTGLPQHLSDWCTSLSSGGQNPEALHAAMVWKEGCLMARSALEEGMAAGGFNPSYFCSGFSKALGKKAAEADKTNPRPWILKGPNAEAPPFITLMATPSKALSYLKDPRPCCKAHGQKGCHDKAIEKCVCDADKHCCEVGWDLRCTELIEKHRIIGDRILMRCGRCEEAVDDAAALKDCLTGGCNK